MAEKKLELPSLSEHKVAFSIISSGHCSFKYEYVCIRLIQIGLIRFIFTNVQNISFSTVNRVRWRTAHIILQYIQMGATLFTAQSTGISHRFTNYYSKTQTFERSSCKHSWICLFMSEELLLAWSRKKKVKNKQTLFPKKNSNDADFLWTRLCPVPDRKQFCLLSSFTYGVTSNWIWNSTFLCCSWTSSFWCITANAAEQQEYAR